MNKALRKLFKPVFICILIFMGSRQDMLAQPLPYDSLRLFLVHFHENTNDNDLKKAVEKVQALYTSDTLNDSLISNLINVEDLLINVIDENAFLNFKPFNRQIVFSFGEKLVSLFQQLPPKNENLYYASALNNLGVLYGAFGYSQKGHVLVEKAFIIRNKNLVEEHPDYAESLINMAGVYLTRGQQRTSIGFGWKSFNPHKKRGDKISVKSCKMLIFSCYCIPTNVSV